MSSKKRSSARTAAAGTPSEASETPTSEEEEGELYAVEEVVDVRIEERYGRELEYRVRWKGYSDASAAWVPGSHFPTGVHRDLLTDALRIKMRDLSRQLSDSPVGGAPVNQGDRSQSQSIHPMQTRARVRVGSGEKNTASTASTASGAASRSVGDTESDHDEAPSESGINIEDGNDDDEEENEEEEEEEEAAPVAAAAAVKSGAGPRPHARAPPPPLHPREVD